MPTPLNSLFLEQTPQLLQTHTSYNTFLKASDTSTPHSLLTPSLSPTSIPPVSRGKHFDTHSTLSHVGMSTPSLPPPFPPLKTHRPKPHKVVVELHFLQRRTLYTSIQKWGATSNGHSADWGHLSVGAPFVASKTSAGTKQQGIQFGQI